MMKSAIRFAVLGAILGLHSSAAPAGQIFTDRTAWLAAVEAAYPGAVVTTDTFSNAIGSAQSITLDTGIISTNSAPPILPNAFNNNSVSSGTYNNATGGSTGSQTITWTLPVTSFAFGADFLNTNSNRLQITIDVDGTGDQTTVINNTIGGASGFLGFVGTGPFTSFVFSSPLGIDAFSMDNASFAELPAAAAVPEPSTLGLLAVASPFVFGAWQRRRRASRAQA